MPTLTMTYQAGDDLEFSFDPPSFSNFVLPSTVSLQLSEPDTAGIVQIVLSEPMVLARYHGHLSLDNATLMGERARGLSLYAANPFLQGVKIDCDKGSHPFFLSLAPQFRIWFERLARPANTVSSRLEVILYTQGHHIHDSITDLHQSYSPNVAKGTILAGLKLISDGFQKQPSYDPKDVCVVLYSLLCGGKITAPIEKLDDLLGDLFAPLRDPSQIAEAEAVAIASLDPYVLVKSELLGKAAEIVALMRDLPKIKRTYLRAVELAGVPRIPLGEMGMYPVAYAGLMLQLESYLDQLQEGFPAKLRDYVAILPSTSCAK